LKVSMSARAEDAHLTMAGPGVRVALDAVILP